MRLSQMWQRRLARPAPKQPLRQLFLATGLGFFLGLIVGPFLPPTWAFDNVPIRIDFPFQVAACGGLGSFVSIGAMHLAPAARKVFILLVIGLIPLTAAAMVALLYPILVKPFPDLDAIERTLPILWAIAYGAAAILFFGAGTGWFRYFKTLPRDESSV